MAPESSWQKAQHVLANVLTCCNLASGIAAILLPGEKRTVLRSRFILIGALCDALDGPLARRSGNPTERGARADGISDVITCGVAPVAVFASCGPAYRTQSSRMVSAFYLVAVAWRVVRYGIGPRRSHVFHGLPVTGAGVLVAIGCQLRLPPRVLTYLTAALGGAMVSPMRVLSVEGVVRRDLQTLTISLPD